MQHQENQNAELDILQLEDFREKVEGFTKSSVFPSLGRQKEIKLKETLEGKLQQCSSIQQTPSTFQLIHAEPKSDALS